MLKLISFITIYCFSPISDPVADAGKDVIYWSEKKLTYDDFKGKSPKKDSTPNGEIALKVAWSKSSVQGKVPTYTIYNKMIRTDSWISMKHPGLLREYQFFWDMQELYVRKVRKDIDELYKKNEKNREVYQKVLTKHMTNFQKDRKKYKGVFIDQEDLYKIVNKQYQDSLKLYSNYKAK